MKSTIITLSILLLSIIALPSQAAASAPLKEVVSEDTNHGVQITESNYGKDRYVRRQVRNSQKFYTKGSKRTVRGIRKHTRRGGRR